MYALLFSRERVIIVEYVHIADQVVLGCRLYIHDFFNTIENRLKFNDNFFYCLFNREGC